jgi:hypothetical protein
MKFLNVTYGDGSPKKNGVPVVSGTPSDLISRRAEKSVKEQI